MEYAIKVLELEKKMLEKSSKNKLIHSYLSRFGDDSSEKIKDIDKALSVLRMTVCE